MNHDDGCSYREFLPCTLTGEGMKSLRFPSDTLDVRWTKDIIYAERGEVTLHLQLLEPFTYGEEGPGPEDRYPTIVYVPGSAWHRQDILRVIPFLHRYAERGFSVAVIEYRPTEDEAYFPSQVHDVKEAIRFLRRDAEQYAIDPARMVVFGDSSGGHTALLTAFTGDRTLVDANLPDLEYGCEVCGVIDLFGPTDIGQMYRSPSIVDHLSEESPEGYLIGQKPILEHPEEVDTTIVMNYITEDSHTVPALIMHGNRDRIVPFEQSLLLYEHMRGLQKDVTFYRIEGADHGGTVFWTDKIIDIVEEFIRRVSS